MIACERSTHFFHLSSKDFMECECLGNNPIFIISTAISHIFIHLQKKQIRYSFIWEFSNHSYIYIYIHRERERQRMVPVKTDMQLRNILKKLEKHRPEHKKASLRKKNIYIILINVLWVQQICFWKLVMFTKSHHPCSSKSQPSKSLNYWFNIFIIGLSHNHTCLYMYIYIYICIDR